MTADSGSYNRFKTKIPSLSDSADIQDAFKVFLYGSVANASAADDTLVATDGGDGLVGHLQGIESGYQGADTTLQSNIDSVQSDVDNIGAWSSWSPTLTGFTVSSSTAEYAQSGSTVHFRYHATLSTFGGAPWEITLPVTMASGGFVPFPVFYHDWGTISYLGLAIGQPSKISFIVGRADTTYATYSNVSNLVPFTWASGDKIDVVGSYKSA